MTISLDLDSFSDTMPPKFDGSARPSSST